MIQAIDTKAGVIDTAASTAASIASEISTTLDSATELSRAAARLVDRRVRERPWLAAMAGAGIGLLVGLCLRRR